jgi:hypothetical protein
VKERRTIRDVSPMTATPREESFPVPVVGRMDWTTSTINIIDESNQLSDLSFPQSRLDQKKRKERSVNLRKQYKSICLPPLPNPANRSNCSNTITIALLLGSVRIASR